MSGSCLSRRACMNSVSRMFRGREQQRLRHVGLRFAVSKSCWIFSSSLCHDDACQVPCRSKNCGLHYVWFDSLFVLHSTFRMAQLLRISSVSLRISPFLYRVTVSGSPRLRQFADSFPSLLYMYVERFLRCCIIAGNSGIQG